VEFASFSHPPSSRSREKSRDQAMSILESARKPLDAEARHALQDAKLTEE
jgi:hypothetical protein